MKRHTHNKRRARAMRGLKEGQVINRLFLEKNGKMHTIVIRTPRKNDVDAVLKFYNKVITETPFLARITPMTRKEEQKWLRESVSAVFKKNRAMLFAEENGTILASCDIDREKAQTAKHMGNFGIAILQSHSGMGLGTKMMEHICEMAARDLHLELVQLHVYHKNKIAQRLYRKMGFKVAGKIPRGVKRGSKYMDNIIMYKVLK